MIRFQRTKSNYVGFLLPVKRYQSWKVATILPFPTPWIRLIIQCLCQDPHQSEDWVWMLLTDNQCREYCHGTTKYRNQLSLEFISLDLMTSVSLSCECISIFFFRNLCTKYIMCQTILSVTFCLQLKKKTSLSLLKNDFIV